MTTPSATPVETASRKAPVEPTATAPANRADDAHTTTPAAVVKPVPVRTLAPEKTARSPEADSTPAPVIEPAPVAATHAPAATPAPANYESTEATTGGAVQSWAEPTQGDLLHRPAKPAVEAAEPAVEPAKPAAATPASAADDAAADDMPKANRHDNDASNTHDS
jgi:hypothetical protein